MDSKTILIGINANFDNTSVCFYQPNKEKPFRKLEKGETIITSSGTLMDQVRWISQTLKGRRLKLANVIAVIGTRSLDFIEEWKSLRHMVEQYGKQRVKGGYVKRITTLVDIQTHFIGKANEIGQLSKDIAAAKVISAMLDERNVPIIHLPFETEELEVFREFETEANSNSERQAIGLVIGRSMTWAINTVEEEKLRWGNRPPSYPTFQNGGEYLIKRNRQNGSSSQ